jgi:hypothetical protein
MSAIDEWVKWWESDGCRSFSKQHPEVHTLFGEIDPENGLQAPQNVPKNVLALGVEPGKEYMMPREDAVALAKDGKFRLRVLDTNAMGRFLDPVLETRWAAEHEKSAVHDLPPRR